MHIPDNYLSPVTCGVMGASMVPVWRRAIQKIKLELPKTKIPMLGVGAAFSFLLMMFNIPLPGGTTGHAVGGTLLAILLGPYAATLSITVALLLQAVLFGDGGILAFGANCFNIAFVIPFVGYAVYKWFKNHFSEDRGEYLGIVFGSYLGLNIGALCTAVLFGIQPYLFHDASGIPLYCPYPLSISIPAMMIPHMLVAGVVEVIFTLAIVMFVKNVSPGSFYEGAKEKGKRIYLLLIILIALTPLGLLASGTAWGEWGADEISEVISEDTVLGYVPAGMQDGFQFDVLIPDYAVSGIPEVIGYITSAIAGVAILIIIFRFVGAFWKERPKVE